MRIKLKINIDIRGKVFYDESKLELLKNTFCGDKNEL